jgi:hypothetical protein
MPVQSTTALCNSKEHEVDLVNLDAVLEGDILVLK